MTGRPKKHQYRIFQKTVLLLCFSLLILSPSVAGSLHRYRRKSPNRHRSYLSLNSWPRKSKISGPNSCGQVCCLGWMQSSRGYCTIPVCRPSCQNRGLCIRPSACKCQVGYAGSRCSYKTRRKSLPAVVVRTKRQYSRIRYTHRISVPPKRVSTSGRLTNQMLCRGVTCFNGGVCLAGECVCTVSYTGSKCQFRKARTSYQSVPVRIRPSTSFSLRKCRLLCDHGTCTTSRCICDPDYRGTYCSTYTSSSSPHAVPVKPIYSSRQTVYSVGSSDSVPLAPTRISTSRALATCYREFSGIQCQLPFPGSFTAKECCRRLGVAWGPLCTPCSQITGQRLLKPVIECLHGFATVNGNCQDINECVQLSGSICRHGRCHNSIGSYWCQCDRGYRHQTTNTRCVPEPPVIHDFAACHMAVDSNGQCKGQSTVHGSRAACCCSVGVAWGSNCLPCPTVGSREHKSLCPGGSGYLKVPSGDVTRPPTESPESAAQTTNSTDTSATSAISTTSNKEAIELVSTTKAEQNIGITTGVPKRFIQAPLGGFEERYTLAGAVVEDRDTVRPQLPRFTATEATTADESTTTQTRIRQTQRLAQRGNEVVHFAPKTTSKGLHVTKSDEISVPSIETESNALEQELNLAGNNFSSNTADVRVRLTSPKEASPTPDGATTQVPEISQDLSAPKQGLYHKQFTTTTPFFKFVKTGKELSVNVNAVTSYYQRQTTGAPVATWRPTTVAPPLNTVASAEHIVKARPVSGNISITAKDHSIEETRTERSDVATINSASFAEAGATERPFTARVKNASLAAKSGTRTTGTNVMSDVRSLSESKAVPHSSKAYGKSVVDEDSNAQVTVPRPRFISTTQNALTSLNNDPTPPHVKRTTAAVTKTTSTAPFGDHTDATTKKTVLKEKIPPATVEITEKAQATGAQTTEKTDLVGQTNDVLSAEEDNAYDEDSDLSTSFIEKLIPRITEEGESAWDALYAYVPEPQYARVGDNGPRPASQQSSGRGHRGEVLGSRVATETSVASTPAPRSTEDEDETSEYIADDTITVYDYDEEMDACNPSPCENDGVCTLTADGEFLCDCASGFMGELCEEVDWCSSQPCQNDGLCESGQDSFICNCLPGYSGPACETDLLSCTTNSCVHGRCQQFLGKFRCLCEAGYTGAMCESDVDECSVNPFACDRSSPCVNTMGSYRCLRDLHCNVGYIANSDATDCVDVNECEDNSTRCGAGVCSNTEGSYRCTCTLGYVANAAASACDDLNECLTMTCGGGSECVNVPGTYRCECATQGQYYDYVTQRCVTTGASSEGGAETQASQEVESPTGEARRSCFADHTSCRIELSANVTERECCCTFGRAWGECASCPFVRTASHQLLCPHGHGLIPALNSFSVTDIDECSLFGHSVACPNGRCHNSYGSFECLCYRGFYYNRRIHACQDFDECTLPYKCVDGTCINTIGSFHCRCAAGTFPRLVAMGIACVERGSPISPSTITTLAPTRTRPPATLMTPPATVRPVVPRRNLQPCFTETTTICDGEYDRNSTYKECCCHGGDSWGRSCSKCPSRDTRDFNFLCRQTSRDRHHAMVDTVPGDVTCGIEGGCANGVCIRLNRAYTCKCNRGYRLNPHTMRCDDINECLQHNAIFQLCIGGRCVNTQGSFKCNCRPGYKPSPLNPAICVSADQDYVNDRPSF